MRLMFHTWAAQAAISRPGRRVLDDSVKKNLKFFTFDAGKLRWPKGGRREQCAAALVWRRE
jgi:hypothetical protein